MPKLNDAQRIMLSTASQRDNRSLYPLDLLIKSNSRARNIDVLLDAGFAEELETTDKSAIDRVDGDIGYGIFVTDAGLAAIGIGGAPTPSEPAKPAKDCKSAAVIELLERDAGATMAELTAATGWLPHSTRAALTGLRKKGYDIDRGKRDDVTCYRIMKAA